MVRTVTLGWPCAPVMARQMHLLRTLPALSMGVSLDPSDGLNSVTGVEEMLGAKHRLPKPGSCLVTSDSKALS